MGEKERAEALLQAAGVTGVAVQVTPETVTLPLAEVEALRAGAAQGETPGQAYVRQQQEAAQAVQEAPADVMSLEEISEWEKHPAPRSGAEQRERIAETDRVFESLRYHQEQR